MSAANTSNIMTKKEIVEVVKETLGPFFKEYNLAYDDFKAVAKTATFKITKESDSVATTPSQIQLVVYETLSDANPTSVTSEGWNFLHRQIDAVQSEIFVKTRRSESNNNNNNNSSEGNDSGNSNDFQVSGDEKITVESLKNFLSMVRRKKDEEANIAGQRRQRN